MRLALIIPAFAALSACGGTPESAGPERRSAAGEVLGGEASDAMLPLDTARSTSPADPRAAAPDASHAPNASDTPDQTAPVENDPGMVPKPEVSGGPGRRQPVGIETGDQPPPE